MIIRAWNGWTTPENAKPYETLLNDKIAPAIIAREIPGLEELAVLRRVTQEAQNHYLTLMTFADWQAVEDFAGPNATTSVVPQAAQSLLTRHDAHSQHFELLHRHR